MAGKIDTSVIQTSLQESLADLKGVTEGTLAKIQNEYAHRIAAASSTEELEDIRDEMQLELEAAGIGVETVAYEAVTRVVTALLTVAIAAV